MLNIAAASLSGMRRAAGIVAVAMLPLALASGQVEFPDLGDFGGGKFKNTFGSSKSNVDVRAEFTSATDEQPALLFVTASVAEGYHIYAVDQGTLPDGDGPNPTIIHIDGSPEVKVAGEPSALVEPKVHVDTVVWEGLDLREHYGRVTRYVPLEIDPGVDLATLTIEGRLVAQSCNENGCLPEDVAFAAQLGEGQPIPEQAAGDEADDAADAPTTASSLSLWTMLGSGILGGLILNLMPCVLPVIGLKVLSFAKQGGESRGRIFGLNLAYSAGLLSVFMVLATLAALVKLGLSSESFGWGELYTLTSFKVGMTALVFAMALSFLGIWELPIPGFATTGKAAELAAHEGPGGAFFMGAFTTILATPCSGPFLGPVFGYTISQPASVIYMIFASVGLGMALPYLLIGLFPSLVSWIPQPGAWMDTFKNLMGFVLLGTVVYLFSTINHQYFIATLTLLVAIWFACWLIGRVPLTAGESARQNAWLGGSIAIAVVGYMAFSFLTPSKSDLPWRPYSQSTLAAAQEQGKTVMVDFTADWCWTCKTNLKLAINRQEVKDLVEKNDVVPLLADWTDRNDQIKRALAELDSISIPLMAIYPADPSRETIVLRDLLTKSQVLEALEAAGPSRGVSSPVSAVGQLNAIAPAVR